MNRKARRAAAKARRGDGRRAAPADAIARVLDRTGYLRQLEVEGTVEAEGRIENLRELLNAAEDFERANADVPEDDRPRLQQFLDQVALVSDGDAYDRRDDHVSLMTAHSAKGLEFPVVFLVGMEEGAFPHAASLRDDHSVEEARRLSCVGRSEERSVGTERRSRGSPYH